MPLRRPFAAVSVLVSASGMLLPAASSASSSSVAGPVPEHAVTVVLRSYMPSNTIAIKAGEAILFVDTDPTAGPGHSFTESVPEGATPRFDSDVTPFGGFRAVPDISSLPAGTYSVHCKIHDVMKGTLTVG